MIERHPDGRLKLSQEQNRRFLTKIRFPEGEDGCWDFSPERAHGHGYGLFWVNGQNYLTHRLSYELFRGVIPDGMLVMHSCDRPCCVRPEHLSLGTYADNAKDAVSKGRNVFGSKMFNAKFSDEDIVSIRERVANGEDQMSIAEEYGVRSGIISGIATGKAWKHAGGPVREPRRGTPLLTEEDVVEMRRLRNAGWKLSELAEKFMVAVCTVSANCSGRNWKSVDAEELGDPTPIQRDTPRGERNVKAKLTEADVREARHRYAEGETLDVLSRRYNVAIPSLHHAIRGRTWAHLPGAFLGRRGEKEN